MKKVVQDLIYTRDATGERSIFTCRKEPPLIYRAGVWDAGDRILAWDGWSERKVDKIIGRGFLGLRKRGKMKIRIIVEKL